MARDERYFSNEQNRRQRVRMNKNVTTQTTRITLTELSAATKNSRKEKTIILLIIIMKLWLWPSVPTQSIRHSASSHHLRQTTFALIAFATMKIKLKIYLYVELLFAWFACASNIYDSCKLCGVFVSHESQFCCFSVASHVRSNVWCEIIR